MRAPKPNDFSVPALYAALEAERQARGMTWAAAARSISDQTGTWRPRGMAASTLTGMRTRFAIEADGVLQMLRWLGRCPEDFVPGPAHFTDGESALPAAVVGQMLRFDTRLLNEALDIQRIEREMTWRQVLREIPGIPLNSIENLRQGGHTGFPHVVRFTSWLGVPVARFVRVSRL